MKMYVFKIVTLLTLAGVKMQAMDCGTWESPITADILTKGAKKFSSIVIENESIYWTELRPDENGRTLIVSEKGDITPAPYCVRTRVNEYGGLAFAIHNQVFYFVNDSDQRIYTQKAEKITPLTGVGPRYGDLLATSFGLIAVQEKGKDQALVLINDQTGDITTLASGHDFYSSPTLSADGKKLAWLTWDLPNMPWDGTELWCADFEGKKLTQVKKIAGGKAESIFQPMWSPKGELHYVSDKTEWWNLYKFTGDKSEALYPLEAEFGLPQWVFGMSTYGFLGDAILCTYFQEGKWKVALLTEKSLKNLPVSGDYHTQIRCGKKCAAYLSSSTLEGPSVVRFENGKETKLVTTPKPFDDTGYFSPAQSITFDSSGGRTAYAYYYPPKNKDFKPKSGELPPLIVRSHGGPTAQSLGTFSLEVQFWTSRGFAFLDVNYGGSTGYGRSFRNSLNDNWGIVDVQDCEAGALHCVKQGLADPKKLIITGGSAGGYTTLASLAFGKTFTLGSSYYGVSDLEALVKETHKFESRYLDALVGPYPERIDLYKARSPINFPGNIKVPVIFFQGREDKIVPLDQAEGMYEALKARGIKTKLIVYDGEQHGFRKASSIKNSYEEALKFYITSFDK